MRRVPFIGSEKEMLYISLDRHRDAVMWKLEGLDDAQLRAPMTRSGTSLIGLVKHLASVEYGWFCEPFGAASEMIPFDPEDPDAELRPTETESAADLIAYYARARLAADAVIEATALDDIGTAWGGQPITLRWVLIHMIEETARHAGHMDIIRELIDGQVGDHPPE